MSTAEHPRRADAVRNRSLALEAAKTLLAQPGTTVTVEAIARQAGLGAATIVRAFGTKDALIDAAVADLLEPLIQRAHQAVAEPAPVAALRRFLLDLIDFQAAHWIVSEQFTRLQVPLTSACRAELRKAFADMIHRAREAGGIRTDIDPDVATVMLGEVTYAIARSSDASPDLAGGFVTVMMDGLRPRGRSGR
ncbi:TetR/AcrR family transcriptional regulator [Streptosporangium sp. NBC_01639]|uniref:TetR/AcrR family transcriptional regulator n=1 Tax=Streptosporangium sp. NBC_01639 TaxID=2975948 RepID=UPI0038682710|nr:TetR/AcrR family transcriptional regulator [Streptosporangium sp. NBC_01639]